MTVVLTAMDSVQTAVVVSVAVDLVQLAVALSAGLVEAATELPAETLCSETEADDSTAQADEAGAVYIDADTEDSTAGELEI